MKVEILLEKDMIMNLLNLKAIVFFITISLTSVSFAQEQETQEQKWGFMSRTMVCQHVSVVKSLMEQEGKVPYAYGMKLETTSPGDEFDGTVIVVNPLTREFAIILQMTKNNLACIVNVGDTLKLASELEQ